MKWLILIFIALASTVSYAKDPFACTNTGGTVDKGSFTFEIYRAPDFDKNTAFRLCEKPGKAFVLIKAKSGASVKVRSINIDAQQLANFKELYEDALGANFKDDTVGLDGSSWCLEFNRQNYLKACFWSPGIDTQARGVGSFVALGTALWNLAGFNGANGKLY